MNPDDERRLKNLRRRVNRARNFPENTCSASRHLHMIAERLAAGKPYPMLAEEPEHCAETLLSVLESLWKVRTEVERLKAHNVQDHLHATARDEIERLREFLTIWIADGSLQTFGHREKFRAEAKTLLGA